MSEVEKMYENAGIEHEGLEWVCQNPDHCTYQNLSIIPENCLGCEYFKKERIYPPFTAEKQLELIKWIACNKINECKNIDFGEILAELINSFWQSLTEEEKQQVKEILE